MLNLLCPFESSPVELNFSSTFTLNIASLSFKTISIGCLSFNKIFITQTFLSIFSSSNCPALYLTVILKHPEARALLIGA